MLTALHLQIALKAAGHYAGPLDGDFGPASRAAADAALKLAKVNTNGWPFSRKMVALTQWALAAAGLEPGAIDGLMGPSTRYALELWQDHSRDADWEPAHEDGPFPLQRDMLEFYGKPGSNHTKLKLPYPFRIAWDRAQTVEHITINKRCAESAGRALAKALDHYGHQKIKELGLDLFGGCFNNRPMRGGKALSTHAFAAALDFDPENNQLRWGADRAKMASPQCAAFLDAFEAEGWVSLGRLRNFDWMHVQAARL